MAQHSTIRHSCLRNCDDFQGSSLARSESRLSESFSMITFRKIIFLTLSKGGRRPIKQSMCRSCKEKVLLAPLYYTDTLVNPDPCHIEFHFLISVTLWAVMVTAKFVFGTGKRQEWWPNGRLTIRRASRPFGIHMKLQRLQQPVGTIPSSFGIK